MMMTSIHNDALVVGFAMPSATNALRASITFSQQQRFPNKTRLERSSCVLEMSVCSELHDSYHTAYRAGDDKLKSYRQLSRMVGHHDGR